MRRIPDEDCGVTKGKTSRCWDECGPVCLLDADLGLPVMSLHFIGDQSLWWWSTGSQNTIPGRVSQKLSEHLWELCMDQPWSTGIQVRGEGGDGAEWGEEEKLSCHHVHFQHSPKAQTKKIIAESIMPCLSRNEKIVCICPFCFLIRS